jgi:hypothetical protein
MNSRFKIQSLGWMVALLLTVVACDNEETERIFEAAFDSNEIGLAAKDESKELVVNYSIPTIEETTVTLDLTENGVSYGTDYTTDPAASEGVVTVTVPVGSERASVSITRLVEFIPEGNSVDITLSSITGEASAEIVGEPTATVVFEEVISSGNTINLQTGGSTMPNQCYIDLSTNTQTVVARDTWELAFYSGSENKVFLNASLLVSAAELVESTDIDAVSSETVFETPLELTTLNQQTFQTEDVTVSNVAELLVGLPVGYSQYGPYTDNREGTETAIKPISSTDADNKVYIVGLGNEVPAESNGSLNTTGEHRGFYKIRVLMDGDNYKLQYAALNATTHEEVTISKDEAFNSTFFSLIEGQEVSVEPAAAEWDINFAGVFSFYGYDFGFGAGLTYTDYGLHNTLGGTGLYQVLTYTTEDGEEVDTGAPSYDDFSISDVEEASFVTDDRAVIGSDWRQAGSRDGSTPASQKDDRYFVIKDSAGNYYKLQFTRLLSNEGERGYAQFVYELL